MMKQTISVHNGSSGSVSQAHNARVAEYLKRHKNQEHVISGGYHHTIIDEDVEKAVNRIFKDALAEYNAKKMADTKHPGRTIDNYYKYLCEQVNNHKKEEGLKGKKKAGFNPMQPCYEMILQIGNIDTVNRTGASEEHDKDKMNPNQIEDILTEAVKRVQEKSKVEITDKDGSTKTVNCIEIIGLYFHDDEDKKGMHAHVDYVPIAHGYKKGLSMQPGLTKALTEMGLPDDTVQNLSKLRTELMMEQYGIDYHDSDYIDENGKQLPKGKLTEEQLINRKLASELVAMQTAQMKLQKLFRDTIAEIMEERNIPIQDKVQSSHEHLYHNEIRELEAVKKAVKEQSIEIKTLENVKETAKGELAILNDELEVIREGKNEKVSMKKYILQARESTGLLERETMIKIPERIWKEMLEELRKTKSIGNIENSFASLINAKKKEFQSKLCVMSETLKIRDDKIAELENKISGYERFIEHESLRERYAEFIRPKSINERLATGRMKSEKQYRRNIYGYEFGNNR